MEDYSRRHILRGSLWTLGALCLHLPRIVASAKEPKYSADGPLNWEAFVTQLEHEAARQHRPDWSQTAYISSVASLLRRLAPTDPALQKAAARRELQPTPDFSDLLKTTELQISLVTFDKGESLPHHDHPSMTGVLTCASGKLFVASYDRIPSSQDIGSSSVLVRNVGNEIIKPGITSALSDTRRNIHFVKALSATQIIDIFTPPYDTQRTQTTNWYRLEKATTKKENEFIAHPFY